MNRLILLMVMLVLVSSGLGCSNTVNSKQKGLYEQDAVIAEDGDSYSYGSRTGTTENTGLDIKYRGFYGAETVWVLDVTEQDQILNMEVEQKVTKGQFKLVLVAPDRDVTVLSEGSASIKQKLPLQQGKYRVKLVGKNADGTIRVSLKDNGSGIGITSVKE